MSAASLPPFRAVNYIPRRVEIEHRADGAKILRNPNPLRPIAPNLIAPIRRWAEERGNQLWLAERDASGEWVRIPYALGRERIERIAESLIRRGLHLGGPRHGAVMILSGNSLEHALLTYGAILAGAPVAPVSRAYSLMSSDHEKLRHVFSLIEPKLIFVQDGQQFARALKALDLKGVEIVYAVNPPEGLPATPFAALLDEAPSGAVEDSYRRLDHSVVAKYLFTSGSTGMPKAVINTHEMMCTNGAMLRSSTLDADSEEPPVLLNWLPWNHTFGGNSVLNGLTDRGGTLYLDGGAPTPGQFEQTLANLREISPTAYSNVPAAYAMLVDALDREPALAQTFFRRLKSLAYGGAALSQDIYERMQEIAIRTTGERIVFSSGYGATETAPTIMNVHWATERMGLLGLPLPGIEIKLVPAGGKYEVRVRGPAVTPGYYKRDDLTQKAFDEDGYYSLGDAARFVNDEDPHEGLVFDGRIAEDFKLDTGTWVSAGTLRVNALHAAQGLLQDALVTGQDRPYVGLLGWPNLAACRALAGDPSLDLMGAADQPTVLATLAAAFAQHNAANPGSSTQVRRLLLMAEPPSVDSGEITDKGYVNQSLSLGRRRDLVERLYADPPGNDVVVVSVARAKGRD
ncbi:MAG: AMP-binding protein [Alphaproteobacteria bacterium]|nr:AMP-binding protein [Alphaproteobacteria bacterium]